MSWRDLDHANERAVLAAVMLTDTALKPLLTDVGLRPEHFDTDGHVFAAMIDLHDRGEPVTPHTLASELARNGTDIRPSVLADLAADAGPITQIRSVGRQVREAHQWRRVQAAAAALSQAAGKRDRQARLDAEELLAAPAEQEQRTRTAAQVRDQAAERALNPPETVAGVPFPFPGLQRGSGGGMRPGQLSVIAARVKQGKSVLLDQCLDQAHKHHFEPHLYLLEMSEQERVERWQARFSPVPYQRIVIGNLDGQERAQVAKASEHIPCGITEAAGWTPTEVIRHARWHRFPLVAVDHMHRFALREEADVAECVRLFRDFAAQTGTHVLLAAQLNEKRVTNQQRPRPTLTDLRGSGMISAEAHHIVFVHRPDDEDGIEGPEGSVWLAACRSGRAGAGDRVVFNAARMRFDLEDPTDWRADL